MRIDILYQTTYIMFMEADKAFAEKMGMTIEQLNELHDCMADWPGNYNAEWMDAMPLHPEVVYN